MHRSLARAFLPLIAALLTFSDKGTAQTTPLPTVRPSITPVSLDTWLVSPTLWETSSAQFPEARTFGFRWVSAAEDAARASSRALRLGPLPVAEAIARFSPETPAIRTANPAPSKLTEVQISIYNRGDSGDLQKAAFDSMVAQSKTTLSSLTGAAPVERGTDYGGAVQSHGLVWITSASRFVLDWSDSIQPPNNYRAEFIRLRVTPQKNQPKTFFDQVRSQSTLAAGSGQPHTVHASELPARLVREADGGEWLPNIPMVNQGHKGYCVTAATERVLRYYGVEVDQNELAQIADSDARAGTDPEVMFEALKKLASRFRVQIKTEYQLSYADFVREINDYNRVARSAPKEVGATLIPPQSSLGMYPLVCRQMKGPLFLEAKTKINSAYLTTFEQNVRRSIERGIPMLWSVQLGLLPEEKLNPQARGGHMRLIVGINLKTREIYYSDTWGLGHELKKMPLANAWTITDGLFTLEPS